MISLLPIALLAASLSANPAEARPASTQVTLDISRAVSAEQLYSQIHTAAEQVCREENRYSGHLPNVQRDCVRDTLQRALSQIDDPVLAHQLNSARLEGLPGDDDQASNTVD